MKKISLEHSIRKIVLKEEERERRGNLPVYKDARDNSNEFIGPNAGPLGFGVYPSGIPSIENTKNLSPYTPGQRPAELQKQQMDQMRGQVSTPAQSSSSTTTSSQPEVKTSASKADERIEPKKVKSIKVNPDGTVKEGYTSLEHSIRKIHNESVGNLVDPKQSHLVKAAFNKPVQIEPPEGEEHASMRALNVSNQRKQIKQAESQTRDTFAEDTLNEFTSPKTKPPKVPKEIPPERVPEAPPLETPIVPKPVKPVVEPAPTEIPGYAPSKPSKTPKEVPTEPTPDVHPGPGPGPKVSPEKAPEAKPEAEASPRVKTEPQTVVEPKIDTKIDTKTSPKLAEPAPKAPPAKTTTTKRLPIPIPFGGGGSNQTPIAKDAPNTQAPIYIHGAKARKMLDPSISIGAAAKQILKRSAMKEETNRKDIDLVARDKTERKKVEYVGRDKLNAKKTLGRQAAYKTNVIDEAEEIKPSRAKKIKSIVLDKKEENLGINPVVETQPRLKPLHMAEGKLGKAIGYGVGGVGAGTALAAPETFNTGVTGVLKKTGELGREAAQDVVPAPVRKGVSSVASAVSSGYEKAKDWAAKNVAPTIDKVNPLLKPGKRDEKGEYTTTDPAYHHSSKDVAAMMGSMIPGPVGAASGIYGAKRALQRGDYGDALINAAGAIPGVGTARAALSGPKAVKTLGASGSAKAADVAGAAVKPLQPVKPIATGMIAHDLTKSAVELSDPNKKDEDETKTQQPQQQQRQPSFDTPAAQASEPSRNRSLFDPTPVKKQGM